MTETPDHDSYIAAAPEQFRPMLGRLRARLAQALPDAREVMKYDMPGFQIGQTIVAGYAAFSKQCGLYVDPGAIADHAEEIAALKLKASKTGVTFSIARPIPDDLVDRLATSSRAMKGA
jgi:uncharacterized protein YdhG (YjbR/CyaY superfamily)